MTGIRLQRAIVALVVSGVVVPGALAQTVEEPTAAMTREVKEAQSYLEGWFGAPVVMPPVEIVEERDGAPELPGHYVGGVIRLRRDTVGKEAELRRVLRHEITHAIIDARTRGNCPHWLQEGIAQFLDGTDVVSTNAWLRAAAGPMVPLFRLEGPFKDRDAPSRERAYRQSASAVSFLVARVGRGGLLKLIERLGQGRGFEQALLESAGLSYSELQQAWESSLHPAAAKPGHGRPES